jgi:hypothetical protein
MKFRHAVLAALAAAVTLTAIAAAGPAATKQRVQIDMKIYPKKTFVLAPLEFGALQRDSGTHRCVEDELMRDGREELRDGQQVFPWACPAWVFTGKHGKLVLRSEFTWIEAGGPYNIATGTWKVVRGTGEYAGVTGGGRSAQVGSPKTWLARYQGYIDSR